MYFVIYDLNDNILAYCDNINELLSFTKVRKNNLMSRLKHSNCYYYLDNNTYRKIYCFR